MTLLYILFKKCNVVYLQGITKGLASYRWAWFMPNGQALKKIAILVDSGKVCCDKINVILLKPINITHNLIFIILQRTLNCGP